MNAIYENYCFSLYMSRYILFGLYTANRQKKIITVGQHEYRLLPRQHSRGNHYIDKQNDN